MIAFPLPDLIDKVAILKLKVERINEPHLKQAYNFYMKALKKYPKKHKKIIDKAFIDLYDINGRIWDNEHEIRKGTVCDLPLVEVGRRCLLIRDLNKLRLAIKERIVEETKSGFKDVSMNVYNTKGL
jgi:hypothetical protein